MWHRHSIQPCLYNNFVTQLSHIFPPSVKELHWTCQFRSVKVSQQRRGASARLELLQDRRHDGHIVLSWVFELSERDSPWVQNRCPTLNLQWRIGTIGSARPKVEPNRNWTGHICFSYSFKRGESEQESPKCLHVFTRLPGRGCSVESVSHAVCCFLAAVWGWNAFERRFWLQWGTHLWGILLQKIILKRALLCRRPNLHFLVIVWAPQPKKENAYGWLHVATIGYDVAIGIISTFAALLASIQVSKGINQDYIRAERVCHHSIMAGSIKIYLSPLCYAQSQSIALKGSFYLQDQLKIHLHGGFLFSFLAQSWIKTPNIRVHAFINPHLGQSINLYTSKYWRPQFAKTQQTCKDEVFDRTHFEGTSLTRLGGWHGDDELVIGSKSALRQTLILTYVD